MKVRCPHCGKSMVVGGLGRKPLNIGVENVCDALRDSSTVTEAVAALHCSRAYIYKILKEHGMSAKALTKGIKDK